MGFYDFKGNWVTPGSPFYDGKGYLRNYGEGFFDSRGNWVNPGDAFYDGRGKLRYFGASAGMIITPDSGLVAAVGFLLLLPILMLWLATVSVVEWITSHLYLVFFGYALLDGILCLAITKMKGYRNIKFVLSFTGNYMCVLSFIYIVLLYAIPYVMANGKSFSCIFEFTIVLAAGVAGVVILQLFNYYHEKAGVEFLLGILFFALVILMVRGGGQSGNTIESFISLYHIKDSFLFRLLFGFVI